LINEDDKDDTEQQQRIINRMGLIQLITGLATTAAADRFNRLY
jgi:hypothetical protein